MKSNWVLIGLSLGTLTSLAGMAAVRPFSEQDYKATRYEDLGPDRIDVSDYPTVHKENYRLFLQRCSRCHTPARVINSPATSEEDWKHYVGLMHTWSFKLWLKPDDRRWIVDFLTYDSKVRKLDRPEQFARQQREQKDRYEELEAERKGTTHRENP